MGLNVSATELTPELIVLFDLAYGAISESFESWVVVLHSKHTSVRVTTAQNAGDPPLSLQHLIGGSITQMYHFLLFTFMKE